MKSLWLIIVVILLASGCMTARRRFVPTQSVPGYASRPTGGYGASSRQGSPYGASQVAPYYGGGYGSGYGQIQPYFVSEYAGSAYDPRTHGAVVRTEMMREQVRQSGFVHSAPTTSITGATREDLGAVMDEVDTLRQEVSGR